MEPIDVWRVDRDTCAHCAEPIHMTPMINPAGGPPAEIWTHVASGHERCAGRDTCAAPAGHDGGHA